MKQEYLNFALQGMATDYINPHKDLHTVSCSDSKPSRKRAMTNKQKKSRAASKRANKARKQGR